MEIKVQTTNGREFGFAYNTRTEWIMGETKRAAGYAYNEEVQDSNAIIMRHYSALKSYGLAKNNLPEDYSIDEFIGFLDSLPPTEWNKLYEAAESGLGFTYRHNLQMMQKMMLMAAVADPKTGSNGKPSGKGAKA